MDRIPPAPVFFGNKNFVFFSYNRRLLTFVTLFSQTDCFQLLEITDSQLIFAGLVLAKMTFLKNLKVFQKLLVKFLMMRVVSFGIYLGFFAIFVILFLRFFALFEDFCLIIFDFFV